MVYDGLWRLVTIMVIDVLWLIVVFSWLIAGDYQFNGGWCDMVNDDA